MTRLLRFLCVVFIWVLLAPALAGAGTEDQELVPVLDRLAEAAAGIETLASDFVQEKYLAVFQEALRSGGRFYYQKPDRLRWELRTPVVTGFALDGNSGRRWRGDEANSESFDIRQDPVMKVVAEQLLAWARPDFSWLQAHYRLILVATAPVELRLEPRFETAGMIDYLQIVFAADGSHVAQVEIHDRDGDYTRLRFSATKVNLPLDRKLF